MNYTTLSDTSKVWIYQSNRTFSAKEITEINALGQQFVAGWNAHGQKLSASFDLLYDRFIVLMVDENSAHASGCSIDSSVGFIKKIEQQYQVNLMDRMNVAYLKDEVIATTPLHQMQNLLAEHLIDDGTIVFNNLVSTKKDFMSNWKTPIKSSWHAKMLVL
jgi:hypothetical protein